MGAAPGGDVLELDVVLAGQNPSGLAQAVAAVSTPGSPQYRHYLTAAQYAAHYGPSASEVGQVTSYLTGRAGPRYEKSLWKFSDDKPEAKPNFEVEIDRTKRFQKILG